MGSFTLNADGVTVTHADTSGDGTPLCGWMSEGETASADRALVTCRDCIAAAPRTDGKCPVWH